MPFVYSTATGANKYVEYHPYNKNEASARIKRVIATIAGGANLAPVAGNLVTPRGVATQVTDEQLKALMNCEAFKRHMEAGFMHVDDSKERRDPDKVVRDVGMNPKDGSAPLTPDSKEVLGTLKPVVNKPEKGKKD
jgi:hypothetical protein